VASGGALFGAPLAGTEPVVADGVVAPVASVLPAVAPPAAALGAAVEPDVVAEALAVVPVDAEPDHQSLDARIRGEAFR
jgi:hypothetical protein